MLKPFGMLSSSITNLSLKRWMFGATVLFEPTELLGIEWDNRVLEIFPVLMDITVVA